MILNIDFGNSRLKWCLNENHNQGVFDASVMESSLRSLPWAVINSVRIASVGDLKLTKKIRALCRDFSNPDCTVSQVDLMAIPDWFSLGKTDASQIGVDRVMAMLGAHEPNNSYMVIDAGTAVTIDYVSNSTHQGGYIVPGLGLARRALMERTARVGQLDCAVYSARLEPGYATQSAVEHGIRRSLITFCQRLIDCPPTETIDRVVLSGGDSKWLAAQLSGSLLIEPDLVFHGMNRFFTDLS